MIGSLRASAALAIFAGALACGGAATSSQHAAARWEEDVAGRHVELALSCVRRTYPNKVAHVLRGEQDVASPRALTPAFHGCYDWHSAVHGHWLLVRALREHPEAPFASAAAQALRDNLTADKLAVELAYVSPVERVGFERPYGLAWFLTLVAELHEADGDPALAAMRAASAPLEELAARRLLTWLDKLTHPIRSGEHAQTAFAMGLVLDWADRTGQPEAAARLRARALAFYESDTSCPIHYEPSGHDFLSPCLGEADLMRRVLKPDDYAKWLARALPRAGAGGEWLVPVTPADRSDGKLAHLDGLNLSRAFMLRGIAAGLPTGDARVPGLLASADAHAQAGLEAVTGEHYAGGHWLATFAAYLLTSRGLPPPAGSAWP